MIFIKFKFGQGLGNQLWLLFAALNFSIFYKKKLIIENYKYFLGKDFISLKNIKIFSSKNNFNKIKIYDFYEVLYYEKKLKSYINIYDEGVYKLNNYKNIRINGLFQSDKYLKYINKNILNKFIKIKPYEINFKKNTCILNIRGGEYKRYKNLILPKNYWLNAMKLMLKINRNISFIVVTDDYRYAKTLFPNFTIISENIHQCFVAIQNAPYLILSNSSFSYFPIYLSNLDKQKVIAPYLWSRFSNKYSVWYSPTNYYSEWTWINNLGKVISKKECKSTQLSSEKYFSNNFNDIGEHIHKQNHSSISIFFIIVKKFIKKYLNIFYPNVF